VGRDVLYPLAVDVDLAPIAQRLQELRAGERAILAFDNFFRALQHGVISRLVGHISLFEKTVIDCTVALSTLETTSPAIGGLPARGRAFHVDPIPFRCGARRLWNRSRG
jgi:hypothetical protein